MNSSLQDKTKKLNFKCYSNKKLLSKPTRTVLPMNLNLNLNSNYISSSQYWQAIDPNKYLLAIIIQYRTKLTNYPITQIIHACIIMYKQTPQKWSFRFQLAADFDKISKIILMTLADNVWIICLVNVCGSFHCARCVRSSEALIPATWQSAGNHDKITKSAFPCFHSSEMNNLLR